MDAKRKEMDLLSNSIAAYAHIKVIRISCKPRTTTAPLTPERKQLKDFCEDDEDEDSDDEEEEEEEENEDKVGDVEATITHCSTEIPMGNHHSTLDGNVNVFTSAEELERAQRLEERERIIREIWRNGQPDILGTGTSTIGRVHYY
ncbi:eva-1 homolog Ba isoform X2 [Ictalurus punctatus]|uniref:Eva-1 homolog Ba isoform X2 n=1 Tax=Ictalurus punctatus TaxID=7998 RepID=A0A2D0RMZ4_ICTPU|nr:eva-1 homolog Ba isoform X2 [Ictalurus punctatus]